MYDNIFQRKAAEAEYAELKFQLLTNIFLLCFWFVVDVVIPLALIAALVYGMC
jgi:hypothetical protein